jgi:hypothetical protein
MQWKESSSFFLLSQEGLFTLLLLLSLSFSVFFFLISPKKWNGAPRGLHGRTSGMGT